MVLFAYNFPHRKTQDFILFCVLNRIPIKIILAQNKIELNHEKISFNFKNDIPCIFNPKNPQGKDFISKYSDRCPMKRMAESEEIVGAIVYLASDLASYTTGQNITVDGGLSAW